MRDILEIWSNRRREQLSSLFDDEALSSASAREQLVRHLSMLAAVNTDDPDLARVITTGRVAELAAFDEPFPVFEALQVSVALGQERGEFRAEPSAALVAEVLTSFYTDTLQRWLLAVNAQAFSLDDGQGRVARLTHRASRRLTDTLSVRKPDEHSARRSPPTTHRSYDTGMTAAAHSSEPRRTTPPAAPEQPLSRWDEEAAKRFSSPAEVRAALLPEEVAAFDQSYGRALEIAKDDLRLDELLATLANWRRIALTTVLDPQRHREMLAAAAEIQRTGQPRPGSVSWDGLAADLGI